VPKRFKPNPEPDKWAGLIMPGDAITGAYPVPIMDRSLVYLVSDSVTISVQKESVQGRQVSHGMAVHAENVPLAVLHDRGRHSM
jgi:hypothetical protein